MKSKPGAGSNLPVQLFKDKKGWENWMDKNHLTSSGLWLRIAKKSVEPQIVILCGSARSSITLWVDRRPEKNL